MTLQQLEIKTKKMETDRLIREYLYPTIETAYEKGWLSVSEWTTISLKDLYKETYVYPKFADFMLTRKMIENLSKETIIDGLVTGLTLYDLFEMDLEANRVYKEDQNDTI